MAARPRYRRHTHRRGKPLSGAVRRCGRAGVAHAKWVLDHPDGPENDHEQLVLDLGLGSHGDGDGDTDGGA